MAAGLVVTANGGLCKTYLYVQQPMKLEASSGRAVSSHMKERNPIEVLHIFFRRMIILKVETRLAPINR